MRDDLVKRLNVFRLKDDEYQFIPLYVSEIIGEAADAICELLFRVGQAEALIDYYQNTSRWIPVTKQENLPNTDSGVVGYFGGGAFDQLRWYDFVCTLSDGSIVGENMERNVLNEHCIAVFKLPEPPKEE